MTNMRYDISWILLRHSIFMDIIAVFNIPGYSAIDSHIFMKSYFIGVKICLSKFRRVWQKWNARPTKRCCMHWFNHLHACHTQFRDLHLPRLATKRLKQMSTHWKYMSELCWGSRKYWNSLTLSSDFSFMLKSLLQ